MVFTAVLAAIAVIAAMVHVPGAEAQDASDERYSIEPNKGFEAASTLDPADSLKANNWGSLVWAGAPLDNFKGHKLNDAGWGWCIDPYQNIPLQSGNRYDKSQAGKAPIPEGREDAAINVATKMHQAILEGNQDVVATYSIYLGALIGFEGYSGSGAAEKMRLSLIHI